MVCEQHAADRAAKTAKESGAEEHTASPMVQMEAY
jgi:hypothetical protein